MSYHILFFYSNMSCKQFDKFSCMVIWNLPLQNHNIYDDTFKRKLFSVQYFQPHFPFWKIKQPHITLTFLRKS